MANYLDEEELIEQVQVGKMTMLDYVTRHNPEWDEAFTKFCSERNIESDEASAWLFLDYLSETMDTSLTAEVS